MHIYINHLIESLQPSDIIHEVKMTVNINQIFSKELNVCENGTGEQGFLTSHTIP